jgi:hypothetical protein
LQQAELQIKQQDAQRKAQKDASDTQATMAKIETERMRIQQQAQSEQQKMDAQAQRHAIETQEKLQLEKLRLGVEVAKENARINKGNK